MRCTESSHLDSVNRTVAIPSSSRTSAVVFNLGTDEHSLLDGVSIRRDSEGHSQSTQMNGPRDDRCVSKIINQQEAMLGTTDTKSKKLNLMRKHNILRQHHRNMQSKMTIFDVACPRVLNTVSDDKCDADIIRESSMDTTKNTIHKFDIADKVLLLTVDHTKGLSDFKDDYDGIGISDSRVWINTNNEICEDEVFDDTDIENCDALENQLIEFHSRQRSNVMIIDHSQERSREHSQEHSQEHSNRSNLRDFITSLTAADNDLYQNKLTDQHSFQKHDKQSLRANLSQAHSSHLSSFVTNKNKKEKDRPISKFVEKKQFRDMTSKSVLEEDLTDYGGDIPNMRNAQEGWVKAKKEHAIEVEKQFAYEMMRDQKLNAVKNGKTLHKQKSVPKLIPLLNVSKSLKSKILKYDNTDGIKNSGISRSQNSMNSSQKIYATKNINKNVAENVKLKLTKSSYFDNSHDIRINDMSQIKRNLSPRSFQLIDDP